jgi:hypothetical protein
MKLTCARHANQASFYRLLVLCGVRTANVHTIKLRVMSEWPNSILAAREGSDFRKKPRRSTSIGSIRNGCITRVPVAIGHACMLLSVTVKCDSIVCPHMRSRSAHPAVHLRLRNEPRTELASLGRPALVISWSSSEVHWFNTRRHQMVNHVGCYVLPSSEFNVSCVVRSSQITWLLRV